MYYIPTCRQKDSEFNFNPNSIESEMKNAKIVIDIINEIYGGVVVGCISEETICKSSRIDILLLLYFLNYTLPCFIPKATIDFAGQLHEKFTRILEIYNPSTKGVFYNLSFQGSTEYSSVEQSFAVGPKGVHNLAIDLHPRFMRNSEALLTLQSRQSSIINFSMLKFKLQGTVESPPSAEIFRCENNIYAATTSNFSFSVHNPIPKDGKFRVTIKEKRLFSDRGSKENIYSVFFISNG